MNELELKNLWKSVQDNQENILYINNQNRKEVARLKMIYLVRNLAPIKKFAILVGTAWVLCGSMVISNLFLHAYPLVNKFFLFSATAQVTVTAIALIIYIYQLIKIYQVDLSETVLQTQIKLANLKISTLWSTKILFLQLPFWTTFWWNSNIFTSWSWWQEAIVLFITLTFTVASIWLFLNLSLKNQNKSWFKFIFNGNEWDPLTRSMDLLNETKEL